MNANSTCIYRSADPRRSAEVADLERNARLQDELEFKAAGRELKRWTTCRRRDALLSLAAAAGGGALAWPIGLLVHLIVPSGFLTSGSSSFVLYILSPTLGALAGLVASLRRVR
jgi:hypothetical protein